MTKKIKTAARFDGLVTVDVGVNVEAIRIGPTAGMDIAIVGTLVKGSSSVAVYVDGVEAGRYTGSTAIFDAFTSNSVFSNGSIIANSYVRAINVGQDSELDAGTAGSTKTIDWTQKSSQRMTLTSATNCTISFTAPPVIGWLTLKVISPASGTVPIITWPATVKWAGATKPTQASTLGRANVHRFYYDGTNYWGDAIVNAA